MAYHSATEILKTQDMKGDGTFFCGVEFHLGCLRALKTLENGEYLLGENPSLYKIIPHKSKNKNIFKKTTLGKALDTECPGQQ